MPEMIMDIERGLLSGIYFGNVSYNDLLKPRRFYDHSSRATWLLNAGNHQIPWPLRANNHYRAVYRDGDYIFVTPQTMGDIAFIEHYARFCRDMEGDIAEVGVYYGSTARLILRFFHGTNKIIHLFDTFDAMPDAGDGDSSAYWQPQRDLSADFTKKLLGDYYKQGLVKLYKGFFRDTLYKAGGKKFCFVHIDCDLYEGAKNAAEFFYPRMVAGGVMLFHDYGSETFPGVKRAVDEFFSSKNSERATNRIGGHHLVIKEVNGA